jgi:hypothetical protein
MNQVPDNYRQLNPAEIIRKGDVYQRITDYTDVGRVCNSIGGVVGAGRWNFFRRNHTKKKNFTDFSYVINTPPNVLIVQFFYNGTRRRVQVIKYGEIYLKGLEIIQRRQNDKPTYQFKSFLRANCESLAIESYGPAKK